MLARLIEGVVDLEEAGGHEIRVAKVTFAVLEMGLSENSVPLHPMVNDHYPY